MELQHLNGPGEKAGTESLSGRMTWQTARRKNTKTEGEEVAWQKGDTATGVHQYRCNSEVVCVRA
jgi:hypothetical protein